MIHIATLHHETGKFIKLQENYYKKHTHGDYRIYAGLSDFDYTHYVHGQANGAYENFCFLDFNQVENQHWYKLNCVAKVIKEINPEFEEDDLLIFTDGDAFPVANWEETVYEELAKDDVKVVAIQRSENPEPGLADEFKPYPHPCFFATKLKFWLDNSLNWSLAPPAVVTAGPTLKLWLEEKDFSYTPLLRSNLYDLHPLYFGVYGNIIYHHGAGNRMVYDSIDIWPRKGLDPDFDLDLRYPSIPAFNQKLSDLVLDEIIQDDSFVNIYLMGRNP